MSSTCPCRYQPVSSSPTELDVNLLPNTPRGADPAVANPYANGLPDDLQRQLAGRYADIFRVFLNIAVP